METFCLQRKSQVLIVLFVVFNFLLTQNVNCQEIFWKKIGDQWWLTRRMIEDKAGNLYLSADQGLWFSKDHGKEWNKTLFNQNVHCFALDSLNNVYVGTGSGIFKLSDNGNEWNSLGLEVGVSSILIVSDSIIYAGGYGLFRSTNYGVQWDTIHYFYGNDDVTSLALTSQGHILLGNGHWGIYLSSDNGNSWEWVLETTESAPINSIVLCEDGKLISGTYRGLYYSTDDGYTWSKNLLSLTNSYIMDVVTTKNGYLLANVLNDAAYRSEDGGNYWKKIDFSSSVRNSVCASANNDLFIVTPNVFRSNDGGTTWEPRKTALPEKDVRSLMTYNYDTDNLLLAGTTNGLYSSSDKGSIWIRSDSGITSPRIISLSTNSSGIMFAGTWSDGIFISKDKGRNWNKINSFDFDTTIQKIYTVFDSTVFVISPTGFYKSQDNGNNWTLSNNGLGTFKVRCFTQNRNDTFFAGTLDGGMFKSIDGGDSWIQCNNGFGNNFNISTVFSDPNGILYAGAYWIYQSIDNGDNWTKVNNGPTLCEHILSNSQNHLFVATGGNGIWRSTNEGLTWDGIDIENYRGTTLAFGIDEDDYIYIAAVAQGMYRSSNMTVTSVEPIYTIDISGYILKQNYPNPFNPITTITFTVPHIRHVNLTVYNLLGQRITVLLDNMIAAGEYSIKWDATNFSSGIYFYKLQAEDYSETKKLMILK